MEISSIKCYYFQKCTGIGYKQNKIIKSCEYAFGNSTKTKLKIDFIVVCTRIRMKKKYFKEKHMIA